MTLKTKKNAIIKPHSQMWWLYAMMLSICLSAASEICKVIHPMASTWQQARPSHIVSDTLGLVIINKNFFN